MRTSNRKERWKDCYNSSQKILLVGEGDFSFSACLARAFRTAENMVATSYLDEDWLVQTHWTGVPHLEELDMLGCLLLYEVDVYKMHTHPILKKMKFDIIIFNFPHAGHFNYLSETDLDLIEMHKDLMGAYFRSASKMLNKGGEVHIRHREDYPYYTWDVVKLAGEVGLKLKEKVLFDKSMYHGYHQKRGGGINTNKTFPIKCAFTFKFALDIPNVDDHHPKNEEVCVSELNGQVHRDDECHAMKIKDKVHEALNDVHDALEAKDQVHHSKNDDIPNHGDEDQVPDLDDETVSKMKNDVDDGVNVTEMEDTLNERHEKTSDKVHDVHVIKMKDDIKDQDYDDKVDHVSHMTDHVYGQHPKNDDEIPDHDDKVDVSELKEEVDDDDDDDDGVHVLDMNDTEKNDQVHDVLEMSNDVHEHHDMRNDEVNVDLVHVLEKMNIVEEQHMKNEIHDEHNNIHVLEMKDHDHKQNTEDDNDSHEHKGFYLMDAIKDGDGNVSEMKSYVHDHHNIVGKKDGVDDNDGYLHDHQDHVNA